MDKPDYKEMYLREHFNALQIEMNMINMRYSIITKELPEVEKELKTYVDKGKEPDSDKS